MSSSGGGTKGGVKSESQDVKDRKARVQTEVQQMSQERELYLASEEGRISDLQPAYINSFTRTDGGTHVAALKAQFEEPHAEAIARIDLQIKPGILGDKIRVAFEQLQKAENLAAPTYEDKRRALERQEAIAARMEAARVKEAADKAVELRKAEQETARKREALAAQKLRMKAKKEEAERAALEAQRQREAVERAQAIPLTPAAPIANRTQTALDLLLEKIEKTPEAQIQALVDDENNTSNIKAVELSDETSSCANTYPGGLTPAQVKTKAAAAEDKGRIIYHVEPTQEGPIFMPRKMPNETTLKKDTGEIVYDMVWYEGNPLKATPEKSFIAPDGHPDGSKASVPFEIRSECWAHHNAKHLKSIAASIYLDVNPSGHSPASINVSHGSQKSVHSRAREWTPSNSSPF